jgi:hypothetical protein
MNNLIWLLLFFLLGGAGLISIFSIVRLLLPTLVERTRLALESSLGRSLLLGLVNFLFAGVLVALLIWSTKIGGVVAGVSVFLAGLVGLIVIVLVMLGLVASTSLLGSRMGEAKSPIAAQLRGGALLLLACLTPYLGWFIFTPLVVWTALGAGIQSMLRRKSEVAS